MPNLQITINVTPDQGSVQAMGQQIERELSAVAGRVGQMFAQQIAQARERKGVTGAVDTGGGTSSTARLLEQDAQQAIQVAKRLDVERQGLRNKDQRAEEAASSAKRRLLEQDAQQAIQTETKLDVQSQRIRERSAAHLAQVRRRLSAELQQARERDAAAEVRAEQQKQKLIEQAQQQAIQRQQRQAQELFGRVVLFQAISQILQAATSVIQAFFQRVFEGIKQVEDLRLALLEIAAITVQFDRRDLPGALKFADAQRQSEALLQSLLRINARTILDLSDTIRIFEAILQAGVKVRDALDLTEPLANTVAILTRGQGVERQIFTEVRAIFEGNITANSRIAYLLEQQGIHLRRSIPLWQEQGVLADKLKEALVGFAVAGERFGQTFQGLTSRIKSEFQIISFEGFGQAADALRESLRIVLVYLQQNRAEITKAAQGIGEFFTVVTRAILAEGQSVASVLVLLARALGGIASALEALGPGFTAFVATLIAAIPVITAIIAAYALLKSAIVTATATQAIAGVVTRASAAQQIQAIQAVATAQLIAARQAGTAAALQVGAIQAVANAQRAAAVASVTAGASIGAMLGWYVLLPAAIIAVIGAIAAYIGASDDSEKSTLAMAEAQGKTIEQLQAYRVVLGQAVESVKGIKIEEAERLAALAASTGKEKDIAAATTAHAKANADLNTTLALLPGTTAAVARATTDLIEKRDLSIKAINQETTATYELIKAQLLQKGTDERARIEERRKLGDERERIKQQAFALAQEKAVPREKFDVQVSGAAEPIVARRVETQIEAEKRLSDERIKTGAVLNELNIKIEKSELASIDLGQTLFQLAKSEASRRAGFRSDLFHAEEAINLLREQGDLFQGTEPAIRAYYATINAGSNSAFQTTKSLETGVERLNETYLRARAAQQTLNKLTESGVRIPPSVQSLVTLLKEVAATGKNIQPDLIGVEKIIKKGSLEDFKVAQKIIDEFFGSMRDGSRHAATAENVLRRLHREAFTLRTEIAALNEKGGVSVKILEAETTKQQLEVVHRAIKDIRVASVLLGRDIPPELAKLTQGIESIIDPRELQRRILALQALLDPLQFLTKLQEENAKAARANSEQQARNIQQQQLGLEGLIDTETRLNQLRLEARRNSAQATIDLKANILRLQESLTEQSQARGRQAPTVAVGLPSDAEIRAMSAAQRELLQASLQPALESLQQFGKGFQEAEAAATRAAQAAANFGQAVQQSLEEGGRALTEQIDKQKLRLQVLELEKLAWFGIGGAIRALVIEQEAQLQAAEKLKQVRIEEIQNQVLLRALRGEEGQTRELLFAQSKLDLDKELTQVEQELFNVEQKLAALRSGDSRVRELAIDKEALDILSRYTDNLSEREQVEARIARLRSGDPAIRALIIQERELELLQQEEKGLTDQIRAQEALRRQGEVHLDRLNDKVFEYITQQKTFTEVLQDANLTLFKSLEGGFDSLIDKATAKLGIFRDFARQLLQDISHLILRQILAPVFGVFQQGGAGQGQQAGGSGTFKQLAGIFGPGGTAGTFPGRVGTEAGQATQKISVSAGVMAERLADISVTEKLSLGKLTEISTALGSATGANGTAGPAAGSFVGGLGGFFAKLGSQASVAGLALNAGGAGGGGVPSAVAGPLTNQMFNVQQILITIVGRLDKIFGALSGGGGGGGTGGASGILSSLLPGITRAFPGLTPEEAAGIPTIPGGGGPSHPGPPAAARGQATGGFGGLRNLFSRQNAPALGGAFGGILGSLAGTGEVTSTIGGIAGGVLGKTIGNLIAGGAFGAGAAATLGISAAVLAGIAIGGRIIRRGREKKLATGSVNEMFAKIAQTILEVRADLIEGTDAREQIHGLWAQYVEYLNKNLKDRTVVGRSISTQQPFFQGQVQVLEREIRNQDDRKRLGKLAVPEFAQGGMVPIMAMGQEMVLPPHVARSIGVGRMNAINQGAPTSASEAARIQSSAYVVPGTPRGRDDTPLFVQQGSYVLRQSTAAQFMQTGGQAGGLSPLLALLIQLLLSGKPLDQQAIQALLGAGLPSLLSGYKPFTNLDPKAQASLISGASGSGSQIISSLLSGKPVGIGSITGLIGSIGPLLPKAFQPFLPFVPLVGQIIEGFLKPRQRALGGLAEFQQGGLVLPNIPPELIMLLLTMLARGQVGQAALTDEMKAAIIKMVSDSKLFENMPLDFRTQVIQGIKAAKTVSDIQKLALSPGVISSLPIFKGIPPLPRAFVTGVLGQVLSGNPIGQALTAPPVVGGVFQAALTRTGVFQGLGEKEQSSVLGLVGTGYGAGGFDDPALAALVLQLLPGALKAGGLGELGSSLLPLLFGLTAQQIFTPPEGGASPLVRGLQTALPLLPFAALGIPTLSKALGGGAFGALAATGILGAGAFGLAPLLFPGRRAQRTAQTTQRTQKGAFGPGLGGLAPFLPILLGGLGLLALGGNILGGGGYNYADPGAGSLYGGTGRGRGALDPRNPFKYGTGVGGGVGIGQPGVGSSNVGFDTPFPEQRITQNITNVTGGGGGGNFAVPLGSLAPFGGGGFGIGGSTAVAGGGGYESAQTSIGVSTGLANIVLSMTIVVVLSEAGVDQALQQHAGTIVQIVRTGTRRSR